MKDTMIGVDLAKRVFQLHGATMTGEVKFRKKLSREQFLNRTRFLGHSVRRCQQIVLARWPEASSSRSASR